MLYKLLVLMLSAISCYGASFEYPLATPSSVASTDYIRVVTAAGVSENVLSPFIIVSGTAHGNFLSNLTGTLVQSVLVSNSSWTSGSAVITATNSIPASSAGTQILSQTFTPLSATSYIRINVSGIGYCSLSIPTTTLICSSASSNAIAARESENGTDTTCNIDCDAQELSANTSARTYSVRIGMPFGTWYINGNAANQWGGAAITMTIKEYN